MTEIDRSKYLLAEERNEQIFRADIVPVELDGTSQGYPVVVFIAGQTGAGKTSVTRLVEDLLERRGQAVNLNLDTYKPHHPKYQELVETDDRTVGAYTSIDGHKWMEKAESYAIQQRFDVVMESAMRDPRDFEEPARRFGDAGYRIEVFVVAVHESLSRLGALSRYLQQVSDNGRGRFIDTAIHDACYEGVLRSASAIGDEHLAKELFVVRRDVHVTYANGLDSAGQWRHRPAVKDAISFERNRPWNEAETLRYLGALKRVSALARTLPAEAQTLTGPETVAVTRLAAPLLVSDTARKEAAEIADDLTATIETAAVLRASFPALPTSRSASLPAAGYAGDRQRAADNELGL